MAGTADRVFSFEFFPPATPEGVAKLRATRERLARLGPRFFSVTFGAGGSTRDRTLAAVLEIQASGQRAAPHISCIGSTRESIRATLAMYREHGIGHLVALRGIMPILSFSKLARFSDACGAEIPRWIRRKLESFGDDTASIRAFGLDVVTG